MKRRGRKLLSSRIHTRIVIMLANSISKAASVQLQITKLLAQRQDYTCVLYIILPDASSKFLMRRLPNDHRRFRSLLDRRLTPPHDLLIVMCSAVHGTREPCIRQIEEPSRHRHGRAMLKVVDCLPVATSLMRWIPAGSDQPSQQITHQGAVRWKVVLHPQRNI